MRRWSFISGLTVILLLLLVLSGFCIWTARTLTTDVDQLISNNFDTIRTLRAVRASLSRLDAQYRANTGVEDIPRARGVFDLARTEMQQRASSLRRNISESGESAVVDRLQALVKDYFSYYEEYFSLGRADAERFKFLTRNLAQCSADMSDAINDLADLHEKAVLQRRAVAVRKGQRVVIVALLIAAFSLVIYIWTSVRLTRAIFDPLRDLRDSIMKVRERKFDQIVPLKGGEELAQIATTFNQMASELQTYVAETDQRVIEANRVNRALLEVLPHPIYIVDEEYRVRLMNPRAETLSKTLEIPGALPGSVRKAIDDATAIGCELVGDDLHRAVEIPLPTTVQGAPVPTYLPQVFRMHATAQGKAGWAVLLMDVTKLRQFDQAKTKAISTLGHEVKTPVTSIRMTLHLLLEEKIGPLTNDQRELVAAGRDDCERLLTVLQALLELARFEGGRVSMKLMPTPPADLLMQAEAMHGGYLRGSGAPFAATPTSPSLPRVHADAMHVVRVLGNYLSNAAKYRVHGTPVTMRAEERADGFVRFSVGNQTKRPLTEAEAARVFEPFYRRPGEGAEGTGLGLTISREIAATHGGRVGVWSSGDQVEFYLDLRVASNFSPPNPASLPASNSPS